jgi:hypothetical protein
MFPEGGIAPLPEAVPMKNPELVPLVSTHPPKPLPPF